MGEEKYNAEVKSNRYYWIWAIVISVCIILFTAIFLIHVHIEKEAERHIVETLNKSNTMEDLQNTVDQYEENVNQIIK